MIASNLLFYSSSQGEPGDFVVNSLTLDDPRKFGSQDLPELTGVKTENSHSKSKGSPGGSELIDTSGDTTLGFKAGNGEAIDVINGSTATKNDKKENNNEYFSHGKKGSKGSRVDYYHNFSMNVLMILFLN